MYFSFLVFKISVGYEFGGLYEKFFENFEFRKKNLVKIEAKILKILFFPKKWSQISFFCVIIEFYMFSAFI